LQLPPDRFLKIGSFQVQGNAEFLALAFEIFTQLPEAFSHAGRQVTVCFKVVFHKCDRQNAFLIPDNFKGPNF
jgi:hypothetical protein